MIVGSNNANIFANLFYALRAKCSERKTVVVLDNLTFSKASKVSAIYTTDLKEMFLPPYSCTINQIERLWGLFKTEWRNTVQL